MSSQSPDNTPPSSESLDETLESLQEIIGNDAAKRGMKSLIVPGDFREACKVFGRLRPSKNKAVIILSGFPCRVDETPPTETDGPGGAVAIAKAAIGLGHNAIIVTDACNESVFAAAMSCLPKSSANNGNVRVGASLEIFSSSIVEEEEQKLARLHSSCELLIACERTGPASDGNCYTMRGINMTELGLIAPLIAQLLVQHQHCTFIAIGDGGNEMGMGKVLDIVRTTIPHGEKIACVVDADYLIAASVSNWGAYALAAGAALVRAHDDARITNKSPSPELIVSWIEKCLPREVDEKELLERCVAAGGRDGVTGRLELTVDGLPLEESLLCLRKIRQLILGTNV